MIDLKRYWWPLAPLAELDAGKPLARTLHGIPLVLFRDSEGKPAALLDRCPHRHAPLSAGKVRHGQIACPFHGWRFSAKGCCTDVPGMSFKAGHLPIVPTFASRAEYGLLWVCLAPDDDTPEPLAPAVVNGVDAFFISDSVQCEIDEGAENLLDGFHTHFVHAGWIRRDSKRQTVTAAVRRLANNGIEARYSNESLQSGLVSRFLEGSRTESYGRFYLPGVAEIEYRGKDGLNLLVTAWLTPEGSGRLRFHARVATRQGFTPAWLKTVFLRRLFGVILKQDKRILEQTRANIRRFEAVGPTPPLLNTELDLLGPAIRRLLAGEILDDAVERVLISQI
jgi:phenylpropionate dioxygenase-like ring-hydroxylating dioxygenase large terminal subunit